MCNNKVTDVSRNEKNRKEDVMITHKRQWMVLLALIVAFVSSQCTPAAVETTVPPDDTGQPEVPTQEDGLQPTIPPSPTADIFTGWSSTVSTETHLYIRFPGNWEGLSQLPFNEGYYAKDPDRPIGIIFMIGLSGDPAALLDAWTTTPTDLTGFLTFTPISATDGEQITVSRLQTATKIAQGEELTARTAFFQRPQDVAQLMWFAPSEEWDSLQDTYEGILESIEFWQDYHDQTYGLNTIYLHDWARPVQLPEGDGFWMLSPDEKTGMALRIVDVADPKELLNSWNPSALSIFQFTNCTAPSPADQFGSANLGSWDAVSGECQGGAGSQVTYFITYVPDRDRVLEIILYSPSAQWEWALERFQTTFSMLGDTRP